MIPIIMYAPPGEQATRGRRAPTTIFQLALARTVMSSLAFQADLDQYGPRQCALRACPAAESRAYCRHLARTHYENFHVASVLVPRRLRPHFYAVYSYCRWADDLADEVNDPQRSLDLLDWWETQLHDCYAGVLRHPVFVALRETIDEFAIPIEPLADLLVAFRRDQQVHRYQTIDDLLDYCRYSANPVGRLVLYLGRTHDELRGQLSDSICTGLQLANFCQDVAGDFARGRIYIPLDDCASAQCGEADFAVGRANDRLRRLMTGQVDRATGYLRAGLPLVDLMPRELRGDVWLFAHGGLAILDGVRKIDYDVWRCRPVVAGRDKLRLLAGAVWRNLPWPGGTSPARPS